MHVRNVYTCDCVYISSNAYVCVMARSKYVNGVICKVWSVVTFHKQQVSLCFSCSIMLSRAGVRGGAVINPANRQLHHDHAPHAVGRKNTRLPGEGCSDTQHFYEWGWVDFCVGPPPAWDYHVGHQRVQYSDKLPTDNTSTDTRTHLNTHIIHTLHILIPSFINEYVIIISRYTHAYIFANHLWPSTYSFADGIGPCVLLYSLADGCNWYLAMMNSPGTVHVAAPSSLATTRTPNTLQRSPFAIQELLGLGDSSPGSRGPLYPPAPPFPPSHVSVASRMAYFNAQAAVAAAFLPQHTPLALHAAGPPPGKYFYLLCC